MEPLNAIYAIRVRRTQTNVALESCQALMLINGRPFSACRLIPRDKKLTLKKGREL